MSKLPIQYRERERYPDQIIGICAQDAVHDEVGDLLIMASQPEEIAADDGATLLANIRFRVAKIAAQAVIFLQVMHKEP